MLREDRLCAREGARGEACWGRRVALSQYHHARIWIAAPQMMASFYSVWWHFHTSPLNLVMKDISKNNNAGLLLSQPLHQGLEIGQTRRPLSDLRSPEKVLLVTMYVRS